jgi:REP element-mobilizing transposase RayT
MSHTHTNLLFYIVFATQGHLPLLREDLRKELFAYMAALIKGKGGLPMEINVVDDHVHLLIMLPPGANVSDVVGFAKANSSRFFKKLSGKPFAWQKGFGAFSVSRSGASAVSRYIRDQEVHHKQMSFRDEYLSLLEKHQVDFDV